MSAICNEIRDALFSLQDPEYRDFQGKLIPSQEGVSMIGVRTPELRRMAKMFAGRENISEFLSAGLEPYKVPTYIEQINAVARTSNGKLDRKTMISKYSKGV